MLQSSVLYGRHSMRCQRLEIPLPTKLSPEQWEEIERCCHEPKAPGAETPAPRPHGVLNLTASSQQFVEREKLVAMSLVPETISTLKRAMDRAHDDKSLPGNAGGPRLHSERLLTASTVSCSTTTRLISKQRT